MKDTLYIVMPAYNEQANIEAVVREWYPVCERVAAEGNEAQLVIANDGSKDKTYEILCQLHEQYPLLTALDKPNSGHGATVLYLYNYAMQNADLQHTYIFQTDSDGQTRPGEFLPMWTNRGEFDFQIGTRAGRQDGFLRVVVTKILRLVVYLTFGVWVADANTPFRLMSADMLKPIVDVIPANYNLANVAISSIAVRRKYNIRWQPITFRPRQGGVNSINLNHIVRIGRQAIKDFIIISRSLND